MKKQVLSKLLLSVITVSLLLSGCGTEETSENVESSQVETEQKVEGTKKNKVKGIHITEGPKYQYQLINPDDIIVEYSGLKPDRKLSEYDGKYVTDTSVYLSDRVGVYLGEEHFEAKVDEYINYIDVDFKWNVSDKDLYLLSRRQLEASPSLFVGTITYADGYEGSIDAESVELNLFGDVLTVKIAFRGEESVSYEIEIPELWGDGEIIAVETEEDIREWYENLGGDGSEVDESTASKVNDGLKVDMDLSNESFAVQYSMMCSLLDDFWKSGSDSNYVDIQYAIGDGTIKGEGDIEVYYIPKKDSKWDTLYGSATRDEVFKAYGLPGFGPDCVCYCPRTAYEEAAQIAGMTVDEFEKAFGHAISEIPLSKHTRYTMPGEELLKYIRQGYIDINEDDDKLIAENENWAKVVGVSHEKTTSLYAKEKYGLSDTSMENVLNMYKDAKYHCGYEGDFVSWCNLPESELDSWYVKVVGYIFEYENWDRIKESSIRKYEALGGVVPNWVVYENGYSVNPNISSSSDSNGN